MREHNIFLRSRITEKDKMYLSAIYQKAGDTKCFIPEHKKQDCRDTLAGLIQKAETAEYFYEIPEKMRNDYLDTHNIKITNIPVSLLVGSPAFKNFVEKIRTRLDDFRDQHNSHLFEYRMLRKIKNQAQPVPGLKQNEMPFWIVDEKGNRSHMFRDSVNRDIIPRAITLTLFIRIFLSDLFIHGIGGGRYEQISARLLKSFFNIPGAPYMIASADMYLDKSDCFPEKIPDRHEIHIMERKYDHAPEKLAPQLELSREKTALVEKLKNANSGRRKLHYEIMELNEKIRQQIPEVKNEIEELKKNLPLFNRLRKIQSARDLPFIFYDIDELTTRIKNL